MAAFVYDTTPIIYKDYETIIYRCMIVGIIALLVLLLIVSSTVAAMITFLTSGEDEEVFRHFVGLQSIIAADFPESNPSWSEARIALQYTQKARMVLSPDSDPELHAMVQSCPRALLF